ncbi:zinc ABC transporter substrate-binding protein [Parabacteroides sp. OttesenSCG-928-G21]|nr:zinc ABC transporter substrate-binding protein [Parabacteroides sp. OttesenSCG-928-G21]
MRNAIKYSGVILFFLLLISCAGKTTDEKIISVTIEPQRFFVEKIAGDKFTVKTVVPNGQSPETYDPTPRQMQDIGRGVAYFQIGHIGFEQAWMQNIKDNNPKVQFFDLSAGMDLLENNEAHDHDHADHGHHHGAVDPHIWSSIDGARAIAQNILLALLTLDAENAEYYWDNFYLLMEEIDTTEMQIIQYLQPLLSRAFIIYHPALTYFAHDFNLTQLCIELDGKEPSPAQLKELIDVAVNYNVEVVFVQQEFDRKNAELIAKETNCRLVTINPLAYEWADEMIHIAKSLANE